MPATSRRAFLAACGLTAAGTTLAVAGRRSGVEGAWPGFGNGPTNAGYASATGPTGDVAVRWRYGASVPVRETPVVADGTVYVGALDGFDAVDAVTGERRWRHSFPDEDDGVRYWRTSTAAVDGDTVYVCIEERLRALATADGAQRWSVDLYGRGTAPAVVGGTVYVGTGESGIVRAFDAATGERRWRFAEGGDFMSGPVAVSGGRVYAATGRDRLYAVDAEEGTEVWRSERTAERWTAPVVADGTVYVGDETRLRAFDAADGTERWHARAAGAAVGGGRTVRNWATPAVGNGTVYAGSRDGRVYALDAGTGAPRWTFWTWNGVHGVPAVTDEAVYVGSGDSFVYALDPGSGDRLWEASTGGGFRGATLAVAGGLLFAGSGDERVYAIEGAGR